MEGTPLGPIPPHIASVDAPLQRFNALAQLNTGKQQQLCQPGWKYWDPALSFISVSELANTVSTVSELLFVESSRSGWPSFLAHPPRLRHPAARW